MPATHSIKKFTAQRHAQPRPAQPFADWCSDHAVALVLPLELDRDSVAWIVSIMQSSGEMRGIENISALGSVLKHRRTNLRFPKEVDFEKVMLTARVLFRQYEAGVVS